MAKQNGEAIFFNTVCKFLTFSPRGRRSTIVREASHENNACSSSTVGDEVHVQSFAASNALSSNNYAKLLV